MKKYIIVILLGISGIISFAQDSKSLITPEIKSIAKALKYKITVTGNHPNGGINIEVDCPSLDGAQNIDGVDCSNVLESGEGFVFTRNVDIEVASVDYGNVYIIETEHPDSAKFVKKERQIKKVIDKTSYVFTKESVERIVTMKDGSFDRETTLP